MNEVEIANEVIKIGIFKDNLKTAYDEIKFGNPQFKVVSNTYPFNQYAVFHLQLREYQKGRKRVLLHIQNGEFMHHYEFGVKEFEFIIKEWR